MTSSLHALFQTLFFGWLDTQVAPDAPVEGVTPDFAALLATEPASFSFDTLVHREPLPGWTWRAIEFGDIFDGRFFFYVPLAWSTLEQQGPWAWLSEGGARLQSIVVVHWSHWGPHVRGLVEQGRVLAFAYYPLYRPSYHQWIFALAGEDGPGATLHAAFSAGDWLVAVEGAAADGPEVARQLTALVNSNPWYGWIEAAKAQRQTSGDR